MSINFQISKPEFLEQYQEKKPLLLKGAVNVKSFSWQDANEIYERSDVASHDFKLAYEGIRPKHEYVESYFDIGMLRHRLIKPAVYEFMRKGATLIANKIANEPKINQYARCIEQFTGRQVVNSAYLAFGSADSFRSHWDTRDVFAIQLIGRKRWVVHEPSLDSPYYTQQSKNYESNFARPDDVYMDIVLEPGDVFYLPRGWWHNPSPLGEATFHLAIGTFPAYAMDYLGWAMTHMPDYIEARRSLSIWSNDCTGLKKLGRYINEFITDQENYKKFMDDFVGATRVQSPLALEVFGDTTVSVVSECSRLRISSHLSHGLQERYLIANGAKLVLDPQGYSLLKAISDQPGVAAGLLTRNKSETEKHKILALITDLCRQDILEVIKFEGSAQEDRYLNR